MAALLANPALGGSYYEALAKNGAVAARGNGAVATAVAGGQKMYGVLVDFMGLNAKAKGSPVEFVFPTEGVTAVTEPVAILRTTRNPEAARAFVDFLISAEGQALAVRQGYLGPRELDELLTTSRTNVGADPGEKTLPASTPDRREPIATKEAAEDHRKPTPKPKVETALALSGYCPVSLVSTKQLIRGQTEYTVAHEGRLYIAAANRDRSDASLAVVELGSLSDIAAGGPAQ